MIIQKSITKLIMLIVIFGTTFLAYAQKNSRKPNIVFILADDFGYTSLNSYGADKSLVCTPYIDELADEGMWFTNTF